VDVEVRYKIMRYITLWVWLEWIPQEFMG
jgi:hypothetical protein